MQSYEINFTAKKDKKCSMKTLYKLYRKNLHWKIKSMVWSSSHKGIRTSTPHPKRMQENRRVLECCTGNSLTVFFNAK
jgi:hypothetical protein